MFSYFLSLIRKTRRIPLQERIKVATYCQTVVKPNEKLTIKSLLEKCKILSVKSPKNFFKAIAEQLDKEYIDRSLSLKILTCCKESAKEADRIEVESIWTKLIAKKLVRQPHYIAIMQYYQQIKYTEGVEKNFDNMLELGYKHSITPYQLVLQAYCQDGKAEQATKWISKMEKNGFYINDDSFNRLIQCYLKCGDIVKAREKLEEMKTKNFHMNYHTTSQLLIYYAKQGDLNEIKTTLSIAKNQTALLRNKDMIDVIFEMAVSGHIHHVDEMLVHLDAKDVCTSFITNTITRFVEAGQCDVVPKLLKALKVNIDECTKYLMLEMERVNASDAKVNQTVDNSSVKETTDLLPESSMKSKHESAKIDSYPIDETRIISERNMLSVFNEGTNTNSADSDTFWLYIDEGNLSGIEALLSKGSVKMTKSRYAALINLYTTQNDLTKALATLELAYTTDKSFKLNPVHLGNLMKLMVDCGCSFDEIKQIIAMYKANEMKDRLMTIEQMLNRLAEKGNVELLNELYNLIIERKIVKETRQLTIPLVKVHLTKNDFVSAVQAYEEIVNTKNLTPHTFELMRVLIENNEIDLFKKVYNSYELNRGVSAAQWRLATVYMALGDENEVRNILHSGKIANGILIPEISLKCEALIRSGDSEKMKLLLDTSKGLNFDRGQLYSSLLEIYFTEKRVKEAIELWQEREMHKELKRDKHFVRRLVQLLESENIKVPDKLRFEMKKCK